MPQVPYSPVPSVRPTESPTPPIGVSAGPAAFGVNIGQAIEGLGKTEEQAGNELWQRAVAMQQLRNETEARDGAAKATMQIGMRFEQFRALEGKNSVDDYPRFIQDVQKIRQDIRGSLSNDMVRKMYDGESMGSMNRTILYGASHAGDQQKNWVNQTADANIMVAKNQALQHARDEQGFQASLANIEKEVQTKAALHGWSSQKIAEERAIETSGAWAHRLEGLAKYDPWEAGRLRDANRDKLFGDDIQRVDNIIRQQSHRIIPRNISHDLTTGSDLSYGAGIVSMERAKDAISGLESGGRYDLATDSKTRHGYALGKYQVMEDELQDQLKEAGLPPMTPREFLNSPSTQERLFSVIFQNRMEQYGSFNGAAAHWIGMGPRGDRFGTTHQIYVSRANARLANTASLEEKMQMGADRARRFDPNDSDLEDVTKWRIETDHNHMKEVDRENNFQNRQTIEATLAGNNRSGKVPTSEDEVISDPKAHAAWDKLTDGQRNHYRKELAKAQKGDVPLTDDRVRLEHTLKGMAEDNPAEFLDQSIMDKDLTRQQKSRLLNLQLQKHKQGEADPQVTRALGWIQGDLHDAQIGKGPGQDKDQYYQFVSILQDTMKEFQTEHKKGANMEEVRKMAKQLLQQDPSWMYQHTGGWLGSSPPMFQREPTEEEEKDIANDPMWAEQGVEPTKKDLQRAFIQLQLKKLYAPKTPANSPM